MWHFLDAVDAADVVECVDARGQTAVQAEDLVLDERSQGKVVEQVCKVLPDIRVSVFAQAFVVEAIDLCDLARFVVAAQDGDPVAIAHLERHEQGDCLDRVVATIDVVAHEEVVGIRRVSSYPEKLREVVLIEWRGEGGGVRVGATLREAMYTRLTNCPWISPHTVTGQRTGCTLDSSRRISRA